MKNLTFIAALICLSGGAFAGPSLNVVDAQYSDLNPHHSLLSRVIPQASMAVSDYQTSAGAFVGIPNYSFGVTTEIGRSHVALETGVLYRSMGGIFHNNDYSYTINNGYIGIPVEAKYYFGESAGRSNAVYVKGGAVPCFLVSKTASSDVDGLEIADLPLSSFDLQGVFGVGDKIPVGSANDIMIELTYNRGYLNLVNSQSVTMFNEAVMLTAGFSFGLL